ncbi:MAG: bifunctional oligoribonuclease/PAP phosphatase NrnA [Clostridia bacterium]|nr:bifunctional oligoribonuclease/PAP phosphatase NrnA [Clostridia bacterium]
MNNNSLAEIAAFLAAQEKLTLVCHHRPDGDTLGSAFGLKDLLDRMGKEVLVLCADPVSPRYRFLSDGQRDLVGQPQGAIVCLDIASPEMAGSLKELALQADVLIDHHATNPRYAKMNYVDASAAANGEIMLQLTKELAPLTSKAAAAFYTAIATDTGCFKYGNTTQNTHLAAAELIGAGIDVAALNRHLFQTVRKAELELNRMALETVHYFAENRIATMEITLAMLEQSGAGADELETISSLPAQIEGVKAAATFKELAPNQYKVSLRTDGSVHGGEVCAQFGGGGHKQAAGCNFSGTYRQAEAALVEALTKALENQ